MIKSSRLRGERYAARTEKNRNTYKILMRKPEAKTPLRRPIRMWRKILKLIRRSRMAGCKTDLSGSG